MKSLTERAKDTEFSRLVNGDLSAENAVICWTNFSGGPTKYNPAGGKRTFNLVLTEEIAEELRMEGWNIRYIEPREEGDDPLIITEIVVNMNSEYPPRIRLFSQFGGKKSANYLDADGVGELDKIKYDNVSLIIHPYEHNRSAEHRVKGYLKTMFAVKTPDDDFGGRYAEYESDDSDVPFN